MTVNYIYSMLDGYIELPDKQEFTDNVIAEIRKGKSLSEAINYSLRYIDGLFGRSINEKFVIYNLKKADVKITESTSIVSGSTQTSVSNALQQAYSISKTPQTLESVIANKKFEKILLSAIKSLIPSTIK